MDSIYFPINGKGTINEPFQISKVEHLRQISYLFTTLKKPLYFELVNDIDFNNNNCYYDPNNIKKYENSICMLKDFPFMGGFNGNGYFIKNVIYYNECDPKKNGIFNYCDNAMIKNLNLENIKIIGDYNLGILAGVFVNSILIKTNFYNCEVIEKNYIRNIIEPASIGGVVGKSINSEFSIIRYDINIDVKHNSWGNFIGNIDYTSSMIDCENINAKQKVKKQDN